MFKKHDIQVRAQLLLARDNKHARLVISCKTSKEVWERLCSINEQSSEANKILLQKEFFELKMGKNEAVHDFIARGKYLWNRRQVN